MKIRKVASHLIRPAKYNPRKDLRPGDKEYEKLKRSMDTFGYVEPIIWNERTGNIVGGHQRYKILVAEGAEEVECVVVDLDDIEEKALNVALNKVAGEWDIPLLTDLLKDLVSKGYDVNLTGFDALEIQDLFGNPEVVDDNFDVDAETEAITDPVTQRGDVWTLGQHRLACGDSTSADDIAKLMAGSKATMVFTDPPYNVDYGANKANVRWKIRKIEGDNQTPDEWLAFCDRVAERLRENCTGDLYVWGASGTDGMRARLALIDSGAHWSATIIWKKNQLVLSPAKYQRIYEPCFYGWFGKSTYGADRRQVELWEFDRPRDSKLHPTMKPIALCANGIQNSSRKDDIVLDMFGGSGSTLIAAEQLGRACYMMELDPRYCDVIVKRWELLTGKTGRRAGAGGDPEAV